MLTIVEFSAATAAAFAGQLIYYAVSDGENGARKTWHTAVLSSFKAGQHDDVFDSYAVERQANRGLVVTRDYTTPSGDWLVKLTYDYARNGRLHAVRSELITFGGITISGERTRASPAALVLSLSPLVVLYGRLPSASLMLRPGGRSHGSFTILSRSIG